jgi:hypothetical protein
MLVGFGIPGSEGWPDPGSGTGASWVQLQIRMVRRIPETVRFFFMLLVFKGLQQGLAGKMFFSRSLRKDATRSRWAMVSDNSMTKFLPFTGKTNDESQFNKLYTVWEVEIEKLKDLLTGNYVITLKQHLLIKP